MITLKKIIGWVILIGILFVLMFSPCIFGDAPWIAGFIVLGLTILASVMFFIAIWLIED